MLSRANMKIAYVSDQLLPQTATDTAQLVAMVSALGGVGADIDLVVPARWGRPPATADQIAAGYQTAATFTTRALHSAYPCPIRGIEKIAHGLVAARDGGVRCADVVYTRNLPVVEAVLRLTDRPVVYETYRPWPDQKRSMERRFRRLAGNPQLRGLVLHSALAADSYRRVGFEADRLLVAHNGYDPAIVGDDPGLESARATVGLPASGPVVTYAGNISPRKGLGLVLDVAERLPAVRFVFVGSKGRGPIERRAEGMSNVTIVGWQAFTNTVPWLYASDVLLIPPSRGPLERIGNTVLPIKTFLYMATGRVILAPATPDLQEVLVDDVNAALVTPDDVDGTTERLRALVAETADAAATRDRLGSAALGDARERTWDNRARRVLDFVTRRVGAAAP